MGIYGYNIELGGSADCQHEGFSNLHDWTDDATQPAAFWCSIIP